jgi:flagellin FlaB
MKSSRHDEGFTGLEAAIVLIAFVVVAAVFSYVVLGAGFFTTQKSQEVVHTGVAQASSTLEIVGNVYGTSSDTVYMDAINFTIALAPGGTAVDFEKVVLTYSNATQLQTLGRITTVNTVATTGNWALVAIRNDAGGTNWLLEKGEQFDIMAMPTGKVYKTAEFNLEVKPSTGSPLDIKRTAPAAIKTVNILY